MQNFRERVIVIIKKIPRGAVVSYGQVAAAAGSPRAARQVGGVLRGLDDLANVPWWRVVNSEGYLSIRGNWTASKDLQKALLTKEGIYVNESYTVDMVKYRYELF